MMNEYLISRKGSNAANQSMCELMPLMLIDADTATDALEEFKSTWMDEFTFYANQPVVATNVDLFSDDEYIGLQEIDMQNRVNIVEARG